MRRLLLLPLVAVALAGCGSDADTGPTGSAPTQSAAKPKLASDPAKAGETVFQGDLSPKTHGPVTLDGRYRVQFAQYDPEGKTNSFADQTPFVVDLEKREGIPDIHLFKARTATGSKTIDLDGRYFVDVAFGDFPYVVRFTPVDK